MQPSPIRTANITLLAGNDLREKRKKVRAPKRSAKQKKSGKDESSVKLDLSIRKILAVQRLLNIDFILSPSETDTPSDGNCFIHAILDQLKYDTIWKKRKSHRLSFKQHVHKDHQEVSNHSNDAKLFLGDEAENFEKLYPEETKKRLGIIVERIDTNEDGLVTVEELTTWIDFIHKDHIKRDVAREWAARNHEQIEMLSWDR